MNNDNATPSTPRDRARVRRAILAATASLVLAVPAGAFAQEHSGRHGQVQQGAGRPSGQHQGGRSGYQGSHGGRGSYQGVQGGRGGRNEFGPGNTFRGYDSRDQRPGEGYGGDRRGFNREFRSEHRFRHRGYSRPDGWYSHRWRHGEIFPRIFWGRDYWLMDYWLYNLSPPPYGYVWVRYGEDAVLIDQSTGAIVEVIYGIFY